jgi:hypothetical protein
MLKMSFTVRMKLRLNRGEKGIPILAPVIGRKQRRRNPRIRQ